MQGRCVVQALAMVLRVVALSLPVLFLFALTTLASAAVAAWYRGEDLTSPRSLYLGIVCGLITWLFIAVFHIKKETVQLPCDDRDELFKKLRGQLVGLGYDVQQSDPELLTSRPTFRSLLFGGGIRVRAAGNMVNISGPKIYLEVLRRRLRVDTHIAGIRRAMLDSRLQDGERRLRRVEISMRVDRSDWSAIQAEVLDVLAEQQVDMICDVNILAQSEDGFRESTVEVLIRESLKQRGIKAEIHKEPLGMAEEDRAPQSNGVHSPDLPAC